MTRLTTSATVSYTHLCEIGPGKTLTGFAGKISKELTCKTVQDMAGVQAAAE